MDIPHIDDLKETFTPWLRGKLNIINQEQENNTSNRSDDSQNEASKMDQGVQCCPSTATKESQCDIKQQRCDKASQAVYEHKDFSVQCENFIKKVSTKTQTKFKTKNVSVQCSSVQEKSVKNGVVTEENRCIKCEIPKIDASVQTQTILKHTSIQCRLKPVMVEIACQQDRHLHTAFTQTDTHLDAQHVYLTRKDASVQTKTNLKHRSIQCRLKPVMLEKGCQQDRYLHTVYTQTDTHLDVQHVVKQLMGILSDTDLGKSLFNNGKSRFGSSIKEITENLENTVNAKFKFLANAGLILDKTPGSNMSNGIEKRTQDFSELIDSSVQCDIKEICTNITDVSTQTVEVENKLKYEIFSPHLSPTKPLNISLEMSHKIEPMLTPPIGTPTNLLEVCKKVNFVQICKECDLSMYSKKEARKHWRLHTICRLCRKKFRSIHQTKEHVKMECDVKLQMIPVVNISKTDVETINSYLKLQQDCCGISGKNEVRSKSPPAKKVKLCTATT